MAMKIEEVISGMNDQQSVNLDGLDVPVAVLRNLSGEGYVNLMLYKENKTLSFWGEKCTACFTPEQIRERAKSR